MTLTEIIQELSGAQKATDNIFFGKVVSVDQENYSCAVDDFYGIQSRVGEARLIAHGTSKGMVTFPKVGSLVAVALEQEKEGLGYVLMYSDIDRIEWVIDNEKPEQEDKEKEEATHTTSISFGSEEGITYKVEGEKTAEVLITEEFIQQKQEESQIRISEKLQLKNKDTSLKDILTDLITALTTMTVPTGVGPSGTPINAADFEAVQMEIDKLLE